MRDVMFLPQQRDQCDIFKVTADLNKKVVDLKRCVCVIYWSRGAAVWPLKCTATKHEFADSVSSPADRLSCLSIASTSTGASNLMKIKLINRANRSDFIVATV